MLDRHILGGMMRTIAAIAILAILAPANADPPNPVKTSADVRAYLNADGTMTMDTFKQVLIATGRPWGPPQEAGLDNQCKMTAYVKNVVMMQHVTPSILLSARVIMDGGVCKLTAITVDGD
jgi:hypothetical protein